MRARWACCLSQRWFIAKLLFRYNELLVCTILFTYDNCLTIQKVLIALSAIRIIGIREISLNVCSICHLYILSLIELNVMLLLFKSWLIFLHLIWCILLLLRWLCTWILYQISSFSFYRLRIRLWHIPWICSNKGAWLSESSVMSIGEFIKGALGEIKHHLIQLLALLVLTWIDFNKTWANHVIEFIPFGLQALSFSIALLFCHHRIFILATIELLCFVLLHFFLSSLTKVEHCNSLINKIILDLFI